MPFWGDLSAKITVTNAPLDISFPNIVVAGLPADLTIRKVIMVMILRAINNLALADNYLAGANKTIRIKAAAGVWGGNDIVAIAFPDQALYTVASSKEGGTAFPGVADLSSVVTGNGTYDIMSNQTDRADAIVANAADLELYDVELGLLVWFK